MQAVRIKRIYAADFRKNVSTMYAEIKKDKKLWVGPLKDGEAYVFVAHTGNKIAFLLGVSDVMTKEGTRFETKRTLFDSRVWRIDGGTFDPKLLEDYANAVGLTLGLKTLRQQWGDRYG